MEFHHLSRRYREICERRSSEKRRDLACLFRVFSKRLEGEINVENAAGKVKFYWVIQIFVSGGKIEQRREHGRTASHARIE